MNPSNWPGITEPSPSITYSVSSLYNDEAILDARVNDIHRKALTVFRLCVEAETPLYVLDWQHPAYLFYPHASFDPDDLDEWRIPVFPDGDYLIFIAQDFSFGTFGHPWEQTICVFGEQLINAFEQNLPYAFEEVRRK